MTPPKLRLVRQSGPARQPPEGVIKRSLSIAGHATSISLEEPFWAELKAVAQARGMSLASLAAEIDGRRGRVNLSSALRLHVLEAVQARAAKPEATGPD